MNSLNKKVSAIIPLYNQKKFIEDSINSVLNQTYPNIEIIVVNDGSTDNPFPILKKYKNKIILINQINKGLAAARNTGIRNVTGEYIQFLDADDCLHSEKIRLQLEFSQKNNAMATYCEITQYHERTKHKYLSYIGKIEDMFSNLFNFWQPYPLPIHSLLIKRELFEKYGIFDEELRANEDRYFLSRVTSKGVEFEYFPFIGGFRRRHQYNMTNNPLNMIENTIRYYKKLDKELENNFFVKRYGYTSQQMMCANLTYIYFSFVAGGIEKNKIKKIRRLLQKENIKLFADPTPSLSNASCNRSHDHTIYLRRIFKRSIFRKYFT